MKNLVTGGAGFIGSHLTELLLDRGQSVIVIDDLSTGSIENIEHLKGNPRFSYVIDSISSRHVMAELVDKADVVFHLAAAVGMRLVAENPVKTIETNIYGTELLLSLAAVKKKKVILTSSSEVYGKSEKSPFNEDDDMVFGATKKWRWSYACSKAIDEYLALSYWKEKGLPVVIARLFNTVGPRQVGHYGMVVPRFVQQALNGGPITVYDDGNQTRCFCYVADAVAALAKLASEEKANGEVFNIGSSEEVTINDLAERVRRLVNPDVEIVHIPYEEAYGEGYEDLRARVPDVTKAANNIGFKTTMNLDGIISKVLEYFRQKQNQG